MTMAELKQLPLAERLQLVEDLWDTIADESSAITLSAEQRAELDSRLDALEANPTTGTPWDAVRRGILERL